MRILLVTPFALGPAAPRHGGSAFLGSLAAAMARHAEVGLAHLGDPPEAAAGGAAFAWHGAAPLPPRPTGGVPRLAHRARMLWRWRDTPLVAAKSRTPAMTAVLGRARREFAPDVALVEMAQMAQYLPALAGVPTVLTDHEAGCAANTRTGLGALGDARDRALWRRFVRRFYPLATRVQALTAEDARSLAALLGREVLVRPPVCDVAADRVRPAGAPPRALFLGDYLHGPNPEAARRIARRILPRLRAALPAAELWLAGRASGSIADLAALPGVRVCGFVADLRQLLGDVRLLLAPLYSGRGFRVKCLTALAHGLPVVTNTLGGRGIGAPSPACRVAESDAALADAALELLRSPERAAEAGRLAHEWALEHVRPEVVGRLEVERHAALVAR